jgi:hypothetical protein
MKTSTLRALAFCALSLGAAASAQAVVLQSGPQTGLTLSAITGDGWTQCYSATMGTTIGNNAENVLDVCQGDYLMMAGRETGSNAFLIAAAALRVDTIINTGQTSNTHLSNGSNWYYSPNWSWGFTAADDTVNNNECDVSASSPLSMCLHTLSFTGGYRINDIRSLNDSTAYEKVFFVANVSSVPVPTSLALLAAGLVGFATRRKSSN